MAPRIALALADTDMVRLFLKKPLDHTLLALKSDGRWRPPTRKSPERMSPDELVGAWKRGLGGRRIAAALAWLSRGDLDRLRRLVAGSEPERAPGLESMDEFSGVPEVAVAVHFWIGQGNALHHVQQALWSFRGAWKLLDQKRPLAWSAEDVLRLLASAAREGSPSLYSIGRWLLPSFWQAFPDDGFSQEQLDRFSLYLRSAVQELAPRAAR